MQISNYSKSQVTIYAHVYICLFVRNMDERQITTTELIGAWPNTYTFTKCIAEWMLLEEKGSIPCIIIRPSNVIATANEPIKVQASAI